MNSTSVPVVLPTTSFKTVPLTSVAYNPEASTKITKNLVIFIPKILSSVIHDVFF
jgi:hypothetical protein